MLSTNDNPSPGIRFWWPGVVLAIAVVAVYAQTAWFGFSSYDDTAYVSENPYITAGVTWAGVKEMVLHGHHLLWTPITSISYMIGCNLYGVNAAGHHLTNVLLHIVAAWLVFYALWRYTGAYWFAWLVAAIFALHPLNVESVAWISGRKNQLYAIFWMCSLLAYRRYAIAPSVRGYLAVLLLHLGGLASKPTHLMLPAVLLLLDVWPLGRVDVWKVFGIGGLKQVALLVAEKVSMFALSAAVSMWTITTVEAAGGSRDLSVVSLEERLRNTAYVYSFFVEKLFWPSGLIVQYPYPLRSEPISLGILAACVVLLGALSVFSLVSLWRKKVVFVGWWWYLLVLFPESGLLRANSFLMADRYAYISTIGLLLVFLWPAYVFVEPRPRLWKPAITLALAALVALGADSARQSRFWKDDIALFGHAAAVYPDNAVGHDGLGSALRVAGRLEEARTEFEASLAIPGPFKVNPNMNLGTMEFDKGNYKEALERYQNVVDHNPAYVQALLWLGRTKAMLGDKAGAAAMVDRAAAVAPNDSSVIGVLEGRAPNLVLGCVETGRGYMALLRPRDAVPYFARALALDPGSQGARLGKAASELSAGSEAENGAKIDNYLQSHPQDAEMWTVVGAALLAQGKIKDGGFALDKALEMDSNCMEALAYRAAFGTYLAGAH